MPMTFLSKSEEIFFDSSTKAIGLTSMFFKIWTLLMKVCGIIKGKKSKKTSFNTRETSNRADFHALLTSKFETENLKEKLIPPFFEAAVITRMLKYSHHEMKSRYGHRNTTGHWCQTRYPIQSGIGIIILFSRKRQTDITLLFFYLCLGIRNFFLTAEK